MDATFYHSLLHLHNLLLRSTASAEQHSERHQSGWDREVLACADVGIDPGSAVFGECVADLHHSLWAEQNLYKS